MALPNYLDELPDGENGQQARRGRKKRATAHRIFKSAIELMQIDGYDGVSIEQICERADVARATFFQHFANKAALMSLFSDIVRQRIEAELLEELSPKEQLYLIADHLQGLADELGAIASDMMSAYTAQPGSGFRIAEPGTGIASLVVAIVEKGQADGAFSAKWPPEDVAISLVAAWVAVSRRRVSYRGPEGERPLHAMLDLILSGLLPR